MTLTKLQIYRDVIWQRYDRNKLDAQFTQTDLWSASHLPSDWRSQIRLGPPPLGATEAECYELENLIGLRPEFKDELEAQADSIAGFYDAFAATVPPIGDPVINKVVNKVSGEIAQVVFYFKHQYSRARPFQVSNLVPIFAVGNPRHPLHASYPSGHASQAGAIAEVLKFLIDPISQDSTAQLRLKIDELAWRIGYSREVAGLHFRSDTVAGIELARQTFDLLRCSPLIAPMLVDARERMKLLYL